MINKTMIAMAAALSLGTIAAAQAGEGSVDSRNNVIGAQQYQRGYAYPYATSPGYSYVEPGYSTGPMMEDDMNTGYEPRYQTNDDYDDESGNQ